MTPRPHAPRTKACTACGKAFTPARPLQSVCSPRCAHKKVKLTKAKEREEFKARKAAIKTIPELIREAQTAFNAFIRERDRGQLCICCDFALGAGEVGGAYDCGHYRSTGSAPHLRFDERNAHGQRKQCNRWGAGRAVDYRRGLIERIGLAEVEALEADNRVHKWDRDELIGIRDTYRQKLKDMKRNEA